MKTHTESSKMHIGNQAAKPWWWTYIKSRQWKNSIQNQNIQPWCHLSPELEQSQVSSVTPRTSHTMWGGKLPKQQFWERSCSGNEFSLEILHLQSSTEPIMLECCSVSPMAQRDLQGWWACCSQPSGSKQHTDTTGAAGKCIPQWKTGNITRCTKSKERKEETLTLKNTTTKGRSFWKLIL